MMVDQWLVKARIVLGPNRDNNGVFIYIYIYIYMYTIVYISILIGYYSNWLYSFLLE